MSSVASFYDLKAEKPSGDKLDFSAYKGNVVICVNFTGLEELYQKYKDQGLVVLGFPSDQFGHQNPEDDAATGEFCQRNHGVTFPLLKKGDVNGYQTNEVFKFLKPRAKGLLGERINWNFTKFLVNKRGEVVHRYAPTTKPAAIAADIEKALAESA
ncbi:hypothetical protein JCM10908_005306 [Rhodotorula pacifica]|uniref:glutathione peroxidase n=1 Tax=Rhodotorula pacifica TaxID=1495444 RepID=UPI0031773587